LFRLTVRQICQVEIVRIFKDVEDVLKTASIIINRRKSRAEGHSKITLNAFSGRLRIDMSCGHIDGEPDIIIPNVDAYHDASYPLEKLSIHFLPA